MIPSCRSTLYKCPTGQHSIVRPRYQLILGTALIALATLASTVAMADEGGVSFWLPGLFGSLAATPQQPGWSLGTIYYHSSVSASGDVAASRAITIGQFNPTLNVNFSGSLNASA